MKIIFLLALAPAFSSAWTFTYGSPARVDNGRRNRDCTNIWNAEGTTFEWDRGRRESCCIHLYADRRCRRQSGYSCRDWRDRASHDIRAYTVTDC
ncbi:hypothetical protein BJX63DRAFT_413697 [Aspergillus granulosus]|uniref:Uncharacterized protein n=1 Tax=Aspergillus granulosus TaxID=176169 RepID=A0ABR4GUV7_9EURO